MATMSVIDLLQAMVRFDTVADGLSGRTRSEQKLVDWLGEQATAWRLETQRLSVPEHADQLLVRLPEALRGDKPLILFDSHLDTVGIDGMTIDPFGGQIKDDKLYGRGACDTKGTGAAMLWAMKQYAEAGGGANDVALLFSVDEEVAMAGIRRFVANDWSGLFGEQKVAGVVVGEPTMLLPFVAHHGLVRWELTTRGKAAHSSVPGLGQSAITPMLELIQAVERDYIPTVIANHPRTGPAACSVTTIHGGQSPNVIPDTCVANIDRRLAPAPGSGLSGCGETPEAATAGLKTVLDRVGHPYELVAAVSHPPLGQTQNAAWTQHVCQVLEQHFGRPVPGLGVPFCTHASYFDEAGVPAVVLGPGDALQAHTKDEWVSIAAVEEGVKVYGAIMRGVLASGDALDEINK